MSNSHNPVVKPITVVAIGAAAIAAFALLGGSPAPGGSPDVDAGHEAVAPASGASTGTAAPAHDVEDTGDTRITLLDPGQEPRQLLRYEPSSTDRRIVATTSGHWSGPSNDHGSTVGPSAEVELQVQVQPRNDGVALQLVYDALRLTGSVGRHPAIVEQLSSLAGTVVDIELSARGLVRATGAELPSGAAKSVRGLVSQMDGSVTVMTVALPHEPVGAGARWRVEHPGTGERARAQRLEYTLQRLEGEQLALDFSSSELGARGAEVGRGRGRIELALSEVFPRHLSAETTVEATALGAPLGEGHSVTSVLELDEAGADDALTVAKARALPERQGDLP